MVWWSARVSANLHHLATCWNALVLALASDEIEWSAWLVCQVQFIILTNPLQIKTFSHDSIVANMEHEILEWLCACRDAGYKPNMNVLMPGLNCSSWLLFILHESPLFNSRSQLISSNWGRNTQLQVVRGEKVFPLFASIVVSSSNWANENIVESQMGHYNRWIRRRRHTFIV